MNIQLPKRPDEETMKRLIKARSFLEHAALHSSMDTEFDIMISIHNLDNSIEYMLRIIIMHLEIEELTNQTVNSSEIAQLIGIIQKFLHDYSTVHLPYVNEVKLIRELRNLVQHAMILPLKELQSHINIGYKFFNKCLDKFFGIALEEIRYSALITDSRIKEILSKAEKNIDNRNFLEAVVNCRDVFDYGGLVYNKYSNQRLRRAPAFVEVRDKFPKLYHYIKDIDKKIEMNCYKVDMNLFERFNMYVNHIPAEFCADWHSNSVMQKDWEKEDALFCYSFVADVLYKWQSMQISPLYEVKDVESYEFYEKINGINLNRLMEENGCTYAYESDSGELFFTDKSTVDALRNSISEDQIYIMESETHYNKKIVSKSKGLIRVDYMQIELASNNPAIWEVILWYEMIPFSYSSINSSTIDINECDLSHFRATSLSVSTIDEIEEFRENEGVIDTIEKAFAFKTIVSKEKDFCIFDYTSKRLIDAYTK